ncbi:MAG TPA: succinate dehydrogenase, partial [Candidatus Xenobia bacterium]
MNQPSTVWSSVGKKILTGLTGLGLVLFVIVHLAGNLSFFMGPGAVNSYANMLATIGHGIALPIAEISLIVLFLAHIISGLAVFNDKNKARPVAYQRSASAGGKSRKTVSSQTMIWTGLLLMLFVCIHVAQFRLGPVYPTVEGGEKMR